MKNKRLTAAMAAVIAGAALASAGAHAQTTPLQVWQPPQRVEMDPAKRLPTTPPAPTTRAASQPMAQPQPVGGYSQPMAQQETVDASAQPYPTAAPAPVGDEAGRGGFFLGVQGGKGWVYDEVDQTALAVTAGYRWQAGAVTLVGVEVASGRLDDADDAGLRYDGVDYASVGVNARFNFGRGNPVYGLVRAGYWAADDNGSGDRLDGGYFGAGLGVDFNRRFNMSLVYTNHVYFNDYSWNDDGLYYDINRAETLMVGAEVRF